MKGIYEKINVLALAGILLSIGLISSCSSEVTDCPEPTVCPEPDVCPEPTVCPEEEKTNFLINVTSATGTEVVIESEKEEDGYKMGSTITFSVTLKSEQYALKEVTLDGVKLIASEEGKYSFVMPGKDVTIETKSITLGASSTEAPLFSDEEIESLPELYDLSNFRTYLDGIKEANSKYLSKATFKTTGDFNYKKLYDLNIVSGIEDNLKVTGFLKSSSDSVNYSYHSEQGITGNHFYTITKTAEDGNINKEVSILEIISELEEGKTIDTSTEISSENAEKQKGFYDVFKILNNEVVPI